MGHVDEAEPPLAYEKEYRKSGFLLKIPFLTLLQQPEATPALCSRTAYQLCRTGAGTRTPLLGKTGAERSL